jgi:hypothetical protein
LTPRTPLLTIGATALICWVFFAGALIDSWRLSQPLTTVTRQVQTVFFQPGSKHDSPGARFTFADGAPWRWNCENRACDQPAAEFATLRWEAPLAVTFTIAGDQIVGVRAKGNDIVAPDHDLLAHRAAAMTHAFLGGLGGLATTGLLFLAWKKPASLRFGRRGDTVARSA